eukprot:g55645.t1
MVTAFGEHKVAESTPLVQETFPYTRTLNSRKFATSGTVTTAAGLLSLSGAAQAETLRRCKYRAGQGLVCRFTALFPAAANVANSAMAGLGDDNNGFFFVQDQTRTNRLRILHRNATVDTYVDQKDWNLNNCLGGDDVMDRKDWAKGNIFQIQMQYLGFGAVTFSNEASALGRGYGGHASTMAGMRADLAYMRMLRYFHESPEEGKKAMMPRHNRALRMQPSAEAAEWIDVSWEALMEALA